MRVRRTHGWQAAVAAIAGAALIAGCASTVTGSAEAAPEATGLTSQQSSTGGESSPSSEEATTDPPTTSATESGPSSQPGPESSTASTGSTDTSSASAPTSSSASGGGDDAAMYPTAPRELNEHPSSEESAAALEGRRLAGYVVVPTELMPTYTAGKNPTFPLKNGSAISLLLPDPVPAVATRGGMYSGFSSTRGTEDGSAAMVVGVFEYPDPAKAVGGATDLAAAAKSDGDAKVTVPGFAKAVGWNAKSSRGWYAHAFLATGSLVMYAWIEGKAAEKDKMPGYLAKYFTAQLAALKGFTPTPKDKLQTLLVDPEGVYSRTLPVEQGKGQVTDGYFTVTAMMHFMGDYAQDRKALTDAGVDVVGAGRSTVYRAKDNTGARLVRDVFYQEIRTQNAKMQDYPLPDAPDVRCLQDALNSSYYCTGAAGRYAFEFRSDNETDVKKSVASQIAMLEG